MIQHTIFIFLLVSVNVLGLPHPRIFGDDYSYKGFNFISRDGWHARPALRATTLNTPVELVVIHHSYQPGACFNTENCSQAMRSMQDFHQLSNGWDDIGYNFAVGSDGQAYEGRGWRNVGAHAVGFNVLSIGIVLIGDWVSQVPPVQQLETTQKLIKTGIELGYISPEYKLVGHRQVGSTECPGQALFDKISTWDKFSPEI